MKHSLSTLHSVASLAPMVMTLTLAMDIYIPAVPNIADLVQRLGIIIFCLKKHILDFRDTNAV